MNPALANIAIAELPALISYLRVLFTKRHPEDPVPTEAEILAAYQTALTSSLAKDDQWLAVHPKDTP